MAGAKETPRQKLIGLMYLVLLAMLALQVSSAIIQKFQFLNESIELSNTNIDDGNAATLTQIEAAVEKNKFTKEDVAVLESSKKLRKETQGILDYLSALKQELILASGGEKDENGNYPGAKEEEEIAQIMLGSGDAKNGKGHELKQKLNLFVDYLNATAQDQKLKKQFSYLALDGKEDPIFQNDPEQKNKDFAHLSFESTPLVAALAVLSEKESQILNHEASLLNQLAQKVGAVNIPVDKLRPVVSTSSNYVVAGMEYKADMFMAAYSSSFQPKMTFSNKDLQVNPEGIGSVKFRAGASTFDANGLSKQTWKGTIAFPKSNGEDSLYTISQDYFVVKPVVQIQTAAPPRLYRNCGNNLAVAVPALGAEFNPSFEGRGGEIKHHGSGKITIIPTKTSMEVMIKNSGVAIDVKKYQVVPVPPATFTTNLNMKTGVSTTQLSRVKVWAEPDEDFKNLMPNEVDYRLPKVNVFLVRNGDLKNQMQISSGGMHNLLQLNAQQGDVLVFEVVEAKRKNYLGQLEVAKINNPLLTISIK